MQLLKNFLRKNFSIFFYHSLEIESFGREQTFREINFLVPEQIQFILVWVLAYSQVDELSSNHCSFHCMSESDCNGPEPHQMWLRRFLISNSYSNPLTLTLRKVVDKGLYTFISCKWVARWPFRCLDILYDCTLYLSAWVQEDLLIVEPLTIYYCCRTSHIVHQHNCLTPFVKTV